MVEAVIDPVPDGSVREQACEAPAYGIENLPLAGDVEIALVLPGKARGREILGRRGTPYGNCQA